VSTETDEDLVEKIIAGRVLRLEVKGTSQSQLSCFKQVARGFGAASGKVDPERGHLIHLPSRMTAEQVEGITKLVRNAHKYGIYEITSRDFN